MEVNPLVLNAVKTADAKLLVVTKYWDLAATQQLMSAFEAEPCVIGWGENRTAALEAKQLPRAQTHFIGRLQSRQLPIIAKHCETVHSLASLKHAKRLNDIIEQNSYSRIKVFVQVNVAQDPSKEGLESSTLPDFLNHLASLNHLEVVGLSSMGWGEFEEADKRREFQALMHLKNQYLPKGKTSAGTSRDYLLALEEGIDIVRVGREIVL